MFDERTNRRVVLVAAMVLVTWGAVATVAQSGGVAGTDDGSLAAGQDGVLEDDADHPGAEATPGEPNESVGAAESIEAATIGDVDGDGRPEVVIVALRPDGGVGIDLVTLGHWTAGPTSTVSGSAPVETRTSTATSSPTSTETGSSTGATTDAPTEVSTDAPTGASTDAPTDTPAETSTATPTPTETSAPTEAPTDAPTSTATPTDEPAEPVEVTGGCLGGDGVVYVFGDATPENPIFVTVRSADGDAVGDVRLSAEADSNEVTSLPNGTYTVDAETESGESVPVTQSSVTLDCDGV